MAKMGRPKADKPKDKYIHIRIDEETNKELEEYCKHNNTTKSKLITRLIKSVLGK